MHVNACAARPCPQNMETWKRVCTHTQNRKPLLYNLYPFGLSRISHRFLQISPRTGLDHVSMYDLGRSLHARAGPRSLEGLLARSETQAHICHQLFCISQSLLEILRPDALARLWSALFTDSKGLQCSTWVPGHRSNAGRGKKKRKKAATFWFKMAFTASSTSSRLLRSTVQTCGRPMKTSA